MWTRNPIFIGAHFWLAPLGVSISSPSAVNISQNGVWPDADEPKWATDFALGICESFEYDPKLATAEDILAPSPGRVQAIDKISPYALPEVAFTLTTVDVLAVELALNTARLFATANTSAIPNAGKPGLRGILKAQKYDQNDNLILNWQSWVFITLKSGLKGAPKTLTKPEYAASLLYSPNNIGSV